MTFLGLDGSNSQDSHNLEFVHVTLFCFLYVVHQGQPENQRPTSGNVFVQHPFQLFAA